MNYSKDIIFVDFIVYSSLVFTNCDLNFFRTIITYTTWRGILHHRVHNACLSFSQNGLDLFLPHSVIMVFIVTSSTGCYPGRTFIISVNLWLINHCLSLSVIWKYVNVELLAWLHWSLCTQLCGGHVQCCLNEIFSYWGHPLLHIRDLQVRPSQPLIKRIFNSIVISSTNHSALCNLLS